MKKTEFLSILHSHLSPLPESDVQDILRDQEEYICDAIRSGRTEENIITSLGDPKAFAANLKAELKLQKAEKTENLPMQLRHTAGAFFAILTLAPFNLILFFGPFLALVMVTIAGWVAAVSLALAAFVAAWIFFGEMLQFTVGALTHISSFFFVLGTAGGSLLGPLIMYKLTQWLVLGTLAYLNWNLRFIRNRA
jgi:uncharacterized membrane protein